MDAVLHLRANESLRQTLRQRYRYILVDEFQIRTSTPGLPGYSGEPTTVVGDHRRPFTVFAVRRLQFHNFSKRCRERQSSWRSRLIQAPLRRARICCDLSLELPLYGATLRVAGQVIRHNENQATFPNIR
jgi:hypothetical protein